MSRNIRPYEVIAGSTIRLTWVSSGAVPSSIASTLRDRNEVLVSSLAATSSGGGAFYAIMPHPRTPGWYVNEWIAVVNANTYTNRQFGKVVTMEVD
jgi:hypothetical protein